MFRIIYGVIPVCRFPAVSISSHRRVPIDGLHIRRTFRSEAHARRGKGLVAPCAFPDLRSVFILHTEAITIVMSAYRGKAAISTAVRQLRVFDLLRTRG